MKVLYITQIQYPLVNGFKNGAHIFEAIQDGSGRHIASLDCKTFEPFRELWPIFNQMEEIDYTPNIENLE